MNIKRKSEESSDSGRKAPKMSFAERMMAKMGYQEGQGLGKSGEGILNPIQVKVRPQGVGVGAVREKTEQAKEEAKRTAQRNGDTYDDSEEEERKARKTRQKIAKAMTGESDYTPVKFTKPKKVFKTVADIQREAEGMKIPEKLMTIIDATGREEKLLTSTAGLMSGFEGLSGETQAEKIARRAKIELESYAQAWRELQEEDKMNRLEEEQLEDEIKEQEAQAQKMRGVIEAMEKLDQLSLSTPADPDATTVKWETVVSSLETLQVQYKEEIDEFQLPDAAASALAPLFKLEMTDWQPLEKPNHLVNYLSRLRQILKIDSKDAPLINGSADFDEPWNRRSTPYESLLYTLWLPRIRSTIVNDWDPYSPSSALALVEAWSDVLPPFLYDILVNQLIVQKLSSTLKSWNPRASKRKRKGPPLPHLWIFPWLQYLSSEHTDPNSSVGLLADVKLKFRAALDTWDLSEGILPGLEVWREVLQTKFKESLIRHLLPRLAAHLDANFEVDPSDQKLDVLQEVLQWESFFEPKVLGQILVAEFFPKWKNVLHVWLTSDPDYEEVGQWFQWWKTQFSDSINVVRAVSDEWDKGLELMSQAAELGEEGKTTLPLPAAGPQRPIASAAEDAGAASDKTPKASAPKDITFRDVVEAWCAEEDLLMIPLREAHETTGLPTFRITASADGRGGVIAYFLEDTVYAKKKKSIGVFEPVELGAGLVEMAEKR